MAALVVPEEPKILYCMYLSENDLVISKVVVVVGGSLLKRIGLGYHCYCDNIVGML